MNRIGVYRKKTDIGGFVRAPEKTDFARAAILLIAQRAPIFGGFPFGCAFFAAACDAGAAYLYIPVLAAGAFLSGGNMVQYLAAAFMLWIYKALSAKVVNRYKTAAVCAGALIICGICKQVITGGTLIGALSLAAEAIAGFAGCIVHNNVFRLFGVRFVCVGVRNTRLRRNSGGTDRGDGFCGKCIFRRRIQTFRTGRRFNRLPDRNNCVHAFHGGQLLYACFADRYIFRNGGLCVCSAEISPKNGDFPRKFLKTR